MPKPLHRRLDRRIAAIFGAAVLADGISILVYIFGPTLDPAHIFGAFYITWAGSAAFFTVVGLITTLASLERPEAASFDARARILFRNASGPHVDYVIARVKETFHQYAELVDISYKIVEYDEPEQKFRFDHQNRSVVKSYIDDVVCNFDSDIVIANVAAAPVGKSANRLTSLKINSKSLGAGELFGNSLAKTIKAVIDYDKPFDMWFMAEYWVQANTEDNSYTPKRYTQKLSIRIENNLVPGRIIVLRRLNADGSHADIELHPGQQYLILDAKDIKPAVKAASFKVLKPL